MTTEFFDTNLDVRLQQINEVLSVKGKEYRRNDNPMHNFERGGEINGTSREKAMWGFATKHLVSVIDIFDDLDKGFLPSIDKVDEKFGDLINYLIMAEISLKEKIVSQQIKEYDRPGNINENVEIKM